MSVTLAVPISAFFASFATEAGKDAYAALKRWYRDLTDMTPVYGEVELQDIDGSRIDGRPRALPDDGFSALLRIDWSVMAGKTLLWDDGTGEWYETTESLARAVRCYPELFDDSLELRAR